MDRVFVPQLAGGAAYAAALGAWVALHVGWQAAVAAAAYRLWHATSPSASPAARYRAAIAALAALPTAALLAAAATHLALAADARTTAAGAAPTPAAPPTVALAAAGAYDALVGWFAWGALAWAGGAALGAGRLWLGWRRLGALRRSARPAPPAVDRAVATLARAAGLARLPRVLMHPALDGPLVVGRRPAVLLLPDGAASVLAPDEWEAVVLHELAHVRRGDYAANWGVRLVEAACWWHPGVRRLARAAADAREECCDADAVRVSRRPAALARALVRLAESRQDLAQGRRRAAVEARGGVLASRVRRLLTPDLWAAERTTPRARPRSAAAALLGAAASAAVLAGPPLAAATATASQHLPVAAARSGLLPVRRVHIDGADPAGRFTLRLLNGRVAGAVVDGREAGWWDARGDDLVVHDAGGRVLVAVHLDPRGAIHWEARQRGGAAGVRSAR